VIQALEAEKEELQKSVARAEEAKSDAEGGRERERDKRAQAEMEVASLMCKVEALEGDKDALVDNLASLRLENDGLKDNLASLRLENDGLKLENDGLKGRASGLSSENDRLRQTLERGRGESLDWKERAHSLQEENGRLVADVEALGRELGLFGEVESELEQIREAHARQEEEFMKLKGEKEEEVTRLRKDKEEEVMRLSSKLEVERDARLDHVASLNGSLQGSPHPLQILAHHRP
jgi:chromosome segregation ATPase